MGSVFGSELATFLAAINKARLDSVSKACFRLPHSCEAVAFELKGFPGDQEEVCCVFRSTRSAWLEVVDQKLPLSVLVIEASPDMKDHRCLWTSSYAATTLAGFGGRSIIECLV